MQTIERVSRRQSAIRYFRLCNNLSIKGLAYKAKVNRNHLLEIENGTRPCSELTARRLAAFFRMHDQWEMFMTNHKEIEND